MPVKRKHHFLGSFTKITYPFTHGLNLFLVILISQLAQVYCSVSVIGGFGISLIFCSIGVAYFLTLPTSWMNIVIKRVYSGIVLATCYLITMMQLFCAIRLHKIFSSSDLVIIGDTNFNEAKDFLSDSITTSYMVSLCVLIILAAIMWYLGTKLVKSSKPNKMSWILTSVSIIAIIYSIISGNIRGTGIGVAYDAVDFFVRNYQKGYDLSQTETKIIPVEITQNHPKNIILIVGESYDKGHSQLYGYDKKTTPLLYNLYSDSLIFRFNNVTSSAPSTRYSFKLMFSSASYLHDNDWQTKIMLPTTLRNANYRTHWLSNQTETGVYDNIVSHFAYLCDDYLFLNKSDSTKQNSYDCILIDAFNNELLKNDKNNNLFVLHLMGSHGKCTDRFPDDFAVFKDYDYHDKPENQRQNYADYDNTVLYNDYVISELIKSVNGKEAIMLYFPDHGVDFYSTRDDYAGHGLLNNPESFSAGCQIPFLIYLTPEYRNRFPEFSKFIQKHIDDRFETSNLLYTVLEIAGYDLPDYSVSGKSLFKGDFFIHK